jgi:hypothetical protein
MSAVAIINSIKVTPKLFLSGRAGVPMGNVYIRWGRFARKIVPWETTLYNAI